MILNYHEKLFLSLILELLVFAHLLLLCTSNIIAKCDILNKDQQDVQSLSFS